MEKRFEPALSTPTHPLSRLAAHVVVATFSTPQTSTTLEDRARTESAQDHPRQSSRWLQKNSSRPRVRRRYNILRMSRLTQRFPRSTIQGRWATRLAGDRTPSEKSPNSTPFNGRTAIFYRHSRPSILQDDARSISVFDLGKNLDLDDVSQVAGTSSKSGLQPGGW
jgi:hypothetical protein